MRHSFSLPQVCNRISFSTIRKKKRRRALLGHKPQVKAYCDRVMVMNPKKPNSALRQIAKTTTSSTFRVICHIPGEGHSLQRHSTLLLQSARMRDLPGVGFRALRAVYDLAGVVGRSQGRSQYGTKAPYR